MNVSPALRAFSGKFAKTFDLSERAGHRFAVGLQSVGLSEVRRGGFRGSRAPRASGFHAALLTIAMDMRMQPPTAIREALYLYGLPFMGWCQRVKEDGITMDGESDMPPFSASFGDTLGQIVEGYRRGIETGPAIRLSEIVFGKTWMGRFGLLNLYHWIGDGADGRWVIESASFYDPASLSSAAISTHSDRVSAHALEIAAQLLGPVAADSGGGDEEIVTRTIERESDREIPLAAASVSSARSATVVN